MGTTPWTIRGASSTSFDHAIMFGASKGPAVCVNAVGIKIGNSTTCTAVQRGLNDPAVVGTDADGFRLTPFVASFAPAVRSKEHDEVTQLSQTEVGALSKKAKKAYKERLAAQRKKNERRRLDAMTTAVNEAAISLYERALATFMLQECGSAPLEKFEAGSKAYNAEMNKFKPVRRVESDGLTVSVGASAAAGLHRTFRRTLVAPLDKLGSVRRGSLQYRSCPCHAVQTGDAVVDDMTGTGTTPQQGLSMTWGSHEVGEEVLDEAAAAAGPEVEKEDVDVERCIPLDGAKGVVGDMIAQACFVGLDILGKRAPGVVVCTTPCDVDAATRSRMLDSAISWCNVPVMGSVPVSYAALAGAGFIPCAHMSVLDNGSCASNGVKRVVAVHVGGTHAEVCVCDVDPSNFTASVVDTSALNEGLCGMDVTKILVQLVVAEFKRKNKLDLTESTKALWRVYSECEKAKVSLSSGGQYSMTYDALFEGADLQYTVSLPKFKAQLLSETRTRLIKPVLASLEEVNTKHPPQTASGKAADIIVLSGATFALGHGLADEAKSTFEEELGAVVVATCVEYVAACGAATLGVGMLFEAAAACKAVGGSASYRRALARGFYTALFDGLHPSRKPFHVGASCKAVVQGGDKDASEVELFGTGPTHGLWTGDMSVAVGSNTTDDMVIEVTVTGGNPEPAMVEVAVSADSIIDDVVSIPIVASASFNESSCVIQAVFGRKSDESPASIELTVPLEET